MIPSLVMEDPPPRANDPAVWWVRLTPLLGEPGAWCNLTATYGVKASASTYSHLTRREVDYPPGRWEFCRRNVGKPDAALYARYLGPDE